VEEDGSPALLGTERLRTLLLIVMRNATQGSAWPVTNNPRAKFNRRWNDDGTTFEQCNLNLPLWQLIRASTAAPWFFPPEQVRLGPSVFSFVDGAVTAFNNPALIAALTATLPAYRLEWPAGAHRLTLVSIGTSGTRARVRARIHPLLARLSTLSSVPKGLLRDVSDQQDAMCRVLGECVFGPVLDQELGDLQPSGLLAPAEKKFRYVRYDRVFTAEEITAMEQRFGGFSLDNLKLMDLLQEAGRAYAEASVQPAHFL
jgi:hypothetical protein